MSHTASTSFLLFAALAGGAALPSAAGGDVPARAWLGAERVALRCVVEGPMEAHDAARLCSVLAAEARGISALPLRTVTANEETGEDELVIDITLIAASARPDTVSASVSGSRSGLSAVRTPRSNPRPLALVWNSEGPRPVGRLRALDLFLGRSGPGRDEPQLWRTDR